MGHKYKRSQKRGWKPQEVRVLFSQKPGKEVDFQTECIQDFCDWDLDDFVEFVQTQASQEAACCWFVIKAKRNYEAIQRLYAEATLRGIHLPIPVKIVSAYE